jgi:Ca-activated chloride channel family protein
MTDDFDRLASALKAAPPPEPGAKEAALRLAMENYDRLQASAAGARPSLDPPHKAGFLTGVLAMLKSLATRPLLAATTSAAALGLGLVVILPQMQAPPGPALPAAPEPALMAEPTPATPAPAARAKAAAPEAAPMAEVASEPPMADAAGIASEAPEAVVGMAAPETVVGMVAPEPDILLPEPNTEAFASADPNPVKITAEQPVSTFSADVDTASWSILRSSLNAGQLPPPEAVRIEEMVNYFPYAYPAPEQGAAPFRPSVTVMPTPWNADTHLVVIGLQGAMPAIADRPPLNLVFLIDTSGSMDEPSTSCRSSSSRLPPACSPAS